MVDEEVFSEESEYIVVRPATTALVPSHIAAALRSLHASAATSSRDGQSAIEMLLVTNGSTDRVTYCFSGEGIPTDTLEQRLRRCFPNEYELKRATASLLEFLTDGQQRADEPTALADHEVAAAEVQAREDRAGDWQTQLQSLAAFTEDDRARWPLAAVCDALASTSVPVAVQALLEPKSDWTATADETIERYQYRQSSLLGDLIAELFGLGDDTGPARLSRQELPAGNLERIEEIEAVNTRQSYRVNVRAIAVGAEPSRCEAALTDLLDPFTAIGKTTYQLVTSQYAAGSDSAKTIAQAIATRSMRGFAWSRRLEQTLDFSNPLSTNTHPVIVADPTEVGAFCFVGGSNLTEAARQALNPRDGARTGVPLPPKRVLDRYRVPGFTLGVPQPADRDRSPDPVAVSPSLQCRHMLIVGQTGAGKSIAGINGLLANHGVTDGATILFENKDGQMADDYLRAHYAEYGSLANVYRFDLAEHVPASPFFDVTRQVASGIDREQAVENVADHTVEILRAIMGAEQYDQAIGSPAVIEAMIKAMFDPVNGHDQFTIQDLQRELGRFAGTGHAPPVVSDALRQEFQRITDNTEDTFDMILAGAARRVAKAVLDSRVAPLFSYAPQRQEHSPEPFDWREVLDEDCVVILDTSDLRAEPQRIVTLALLSQLWTALQRRTRERRARGRRGDPPQVTLHVEEAADIASAGSLAEMLKQGRSYRVGVTLSLQYPKQLKHADEATYDEAINNIGTTLAGRVDHDPRLAKKLATDEMAPDAVSNRLRRLAPDEWLVSLPTAFGDEPPRPFLLESLPLPPGHPDGPEPLTDAQAATFAAAETQVAERSRRHSVGGSSTDEAVDVSRTGAGQSPGAAAAGTAESPAEYTTLTTTLPFTKRLPDGVEYHAPSGSVVCDTCEARHGSRFEDLLAAIDCHGDLDAVDRDAVPTVHVGLTLSAAERSSVGYSDAQLVLLQLVYNAHQQRYDPDWEYDIVHDGMSQLRAYAGLSGEEFDQLVADDLLTIDCRRPHTLYTVTPAGRSLIDEPHREGRAHGDDVGDLSESSMHVMMVESISRAFQDEYVADSEHPGATVRTYYPVDDGRLDVAVLDDDGDVVVTAEAERSNHDTLHAVPADFDKMAACDPDEAIWVVEGRSEGHEVIQALHDPGDGEPRVEKTYSESYALPRVSIDEPGFTDVFSITTFQNRFLDS